ncbi:hypothetical protein RhiXN_08487 [Rhizoctonia solani]|uniref:Uncharacterized protein n=1 Tax=Rhizoctonia solani TaxID=456999 RepID=A0A8H8P3V6_9AGAM|nr:uncharacterized protein RhiXN_08487 [Rhizoctonia solani]QRW23451.1 hypothetical protein RhiXN_08487 [Rhizoctonia solani]
MVILFSNSSGDNWLSFTSQAEQEPIADTASQKIGGDIDQEYPIQAEMPRRFSRNTYTGALLINILASALPAIYDTLVKIWISKIDSSFVVTTDAYTYINVIVEVLNEGLPRASYLVIASRLAAAFVPANVRAASIGYVQISSFSALTSATETAVSLATRSIDRPDVPLIISLCRTLANIILDFAFLSTFRVKAVREPTVNTQASIRMACNGIGCIAGLLYFIYVARRLRLDEERKIHTLIESAVRNALYLWLIHGIVGLGSDYATAYGTELTVLKVGECEFNTIRWGLVMVPVNALAATSSTFVGHEWGLWRERALIRGSNQASLEDIIGPRKFISHKTSGIFRPALLSTLIALVIEIPLCLAFSFWLTRPFARYLSGSDVVAKITAQMWRTIDWCYIMYGTDTQLASILLATRPKWYLVNSLIVNVLWVFPWAVALQVGIPITESSAWKYHSIVFGGSLVFTFIITIATVIVWAIWLLHGKVKKL